MDLSLAPALADALRDRGYTVDGLAAAWGEVADAALRRADPVPALRALGDRPLDVLARLLHLGRAVSAEAFAGALPEPAREAAVALGLVRIVGDAAVPDAVVRPVRIGPDRRDAWVASDRDELAGVSPLRPDHVLGVGGAGRTLASLLPPTGEGRALDLGCGCGIIALELAVRGFDVVATDISERALTFTALNAALNSVAGAIEPRLGSLYDPVAGERFALIASNPPFVITPRTDDVPHYEYRDGGRAGDALMAQVVGGLSAHLEPQGQARLLGNWEGGADRVLGWAKDLGLWVVERERLDPAAYAQLWIRDGGTVPGTDDHRRLMGAWLDDFAARRVESIGMGWVLATAADPTLRRTEQVASTVGPELLGEHVAAAMDTHLRLAVLDDGELAASVLVVAGDVTEARHHLPGQESPSVIELRQGGGLGRMVDADPALVALVGACDGDLAVGPLVDAIAQLMEVDAAALRADLLPRVRELLFTGMLRFA